MRILIIGATGMLGHKLWIELSRYHHEVWGTVRRSKDIIAGLPDINKNNICENVDILDEEGLLKAFYMVKPEVVINCVGIIKQKKDSEDPVSSIQINALLPHKISFLCKIFNARFIHFSTDCVFDGKEGNYLEGHLSNATDMYGKSKHLGEIAHEPHVITLRTSMVGRELFSGLSLFEWFLGQKNEVKGYKKAIFSGLTTKAMAKAIHEHILPYSRLSGLFHLASEPISKYHLLQLLKEVSQHPVNIVAEEQTVINRHLNCSKFSKSTGYTPYKWKDMMLDFSSDLNFYYEWQMQR